MARENEVKRGQGGNQGGQEKVNVSKDDKPGNQQMAGENKKFAQENDEQDNVQQGGMQSGRGGRQAGQTEVSGAGQKGNEKDRQLQTEKERGDLENEEDDAQQSSEADNEDYEESELRPGGTGNRGDQQQFTQDRARRKDKSHNSADSDKQHGP
jgi:hypothetical protein